MTAAVTKSLTTSESWTPIIADNVVSIGTSDSEASPVNNDVSLVSWSLDSSVVRKARMSHGQTHLWFPSLYLNQTMLFNCTTSYRVSGFLNIPRLGKGLKQVTHRHEIFRTPFSTDPSNAQSMQTSFADSRFQLRTITGNKTTDVDHEFKRAADYGFNLQAGDIFIASVISQALREHTIIFGYHLIIMDGSAGR
ncbi:hypothetical protein F5B21DRAFT_521979 [Xylaria acuta]|nr:hypothetical protein F5B21DRAFT_521979 [Xylaria acuta]